MTDFYSVLKSSIVRRNLRSQDDRRAVYEQARKAMIGKLWSFEPPLAEDEIDTRIGLFDAAVERIESDLELAFAEADTLEAERPRRREPPRRLPPPEPPRQPLIYEGYDEEADYAPAFGGRAGTRDDREERQPPAPRPVYDEPVAPRRYEQRAETPRQDRAPQFTPPRNPPTQSAPQPARRVENRVDTWEEPEEDDFPAVVRRREADDYEPPQDHDELYEEAAYEEPPRYEMPARTAAYQAPKYRGEADDWQEPARDDRSPSKSSKATKKKSRWHRAAEPVEPAEAPEFDDTDEAYAYEEPAEPKKKTRKKAAKPAAGGRNPVRILAFTIAGLALALIAFNIYVFLPIIFGPEATTTRPAAAPPKIDDRMPAEGAAAGGGARIVSDSATASEISERSVDVAESLVVFDGRDPTVFEGSPDNPIRFASDAEGEYAQISSATSAAGARAVIGPGLAERLAGRTVRITLLARSSAENGASNLRFAYQSGVAISHWQAAQLTGSYGAYGMIWRVPAGDRRGGDYLLIEPGIPGDGSSTDIRSVRIDILAS